MEKENDVQKNYKWKKVVGKRKKSMNSTERGYM